MTDAHGPEDAVSDGQAVPATEVPAAPPSRRSSILRTGFIVVLLVVVFGVILPNAVDYGAVLAAFRGLDVVQLLLVSAAGLAAWVVSGALIAAVIVGLSLARGTAAWLILTAIASSIPFGPVDLGVTWVVVRGWGVSNAAATSGIALYGVTNMLSRLALPILAVAALSLTGGFSVAFPGVAWVAAVASAIIYVGGVALVMAFATSERLADRIGRIGQRAAGAVMHRLGRNGPNVHASVMNFRAQLGEVVRRRGVLAIVLAVVTHLASVGVLVVALNVVGVETLTYAQVLIAYTIMLIILIVPIAPGGAGVPELMLIGLLTAIAGPASSAQVAAGVFLYRIYMWFLPIPIGWVMLKVARRGRPMLPGADELRSFAHGEAS